MDYEGYDGLLIFTIPGPHTLYQLRVVLNEVDPDYDHVNNFIDMHNIGDILVQNKFAHPVMDNDEFTLTYSSVIKLVKDIKAIGKDYTIVPEFRISELMEEYVDVDGVDFSKKKDNFLSLTGSSISDSSEKDFFKVSGKRTCTMRPIRSLLS